MRVPNVNIVIRSNKNHCSVKIQPAWFAEMYRLVWSNRLDTEKGIELVAIDPEVGASIRYTEFADVGAAERQTVAYFVHGDEQLRPRISAAFNAAFPNGLRPIIEKLLRDDLAVTRERLAKQKLAPSAHPSFLAAGLTEVQAIALQRAGFATVGEVDVDDVVRLGEAGLDAEGMAKVVEAQMPVQAIASANPLTSVAKG